MTPEEAWAVLRTASSTRVEVRTPGNGPVVVRGHGTAVASVDARGRLVVREAGTWAPADGSEGRPTPYADALRWALDEDGALVVEQVRRGEDRPVTLGRLVPGGGTAVGLTSRHPHRCGADRYRARLDPVDGGVVLTWSVRGPRKDQRLARTYLSEVAGPRRP